MRKLTLLFLAFIFIAIGLSSAYVIKSQNQETKETYRELNNFEIYWYHYKQDYNTVSKSVDYIIAKLLQETNDVGLPINDINVSFNGNLHTYYVPWTSIPFDVKGHNSDINAGRGQYGYFSDPRQAYVLSDNTTTDSKTIRRGLRKIKVKNTTRIITRLFGTSWVSPLVIDLDGNGKIDASNGRWLPTLNAKISDNKVLFDINGDGFKDVIEWVGKNDGLLIAPNNDGVIDGNDLFGTAGGFDNGFEKLSLYDKNSDNIISGNELNALYIWQDLNQNAKIDKGEMKSVKDMGITKIYLTQRAQRSYVIINGKKHFMFDWWPATIEIKKLK